MSYVVTDPILIARYTEMWNGEGRPGYLAIGGDVITVQTPNGEDAPVFVVSGSGPAPFYGETSTEHLTKSSKSKKRA
jgi:hypothetical protein